MLLNLPLQESLRNRAHDRVHDLPVLEEQDARNRTDVETRGGLLIRVDIQLADLQLAFILARQLFYDRRDHPAWATPGRPEVDQRKAIMAFDFSRKIAVRYCHCFAVLGHFILLTRGVLRVTRALPPCYLRKFRVAKIWPSVPIGATVEFPLDHIAIAVPSISAALPTFELLANAGGSPIERVEAQHVDVAFVGSGGARIELLQPTSSDSTVQKFLDRRGAGLHHIAYRVPDIEAALAELSARGIRLIDETPRPGAGGHRVAFLHPHSTQGVLVELVEG